MTHFDQKKKSDCAVTCRVNVKKKMVTYGSDIRVTPNFQFKLNYFKLVRFCITANRMAKNIFHSRMI